MYPTLKLADVYAAIVYHLRYRQQIQDYLDARRRRGEETRRMTKAVAGGAGNSPTITPATCQLNFGNQKVKITTTGSSPESSLGQRRTLGCVENTIRDARHSVE
jgi:hypothetical protein